MLPRSDSLLWQNLSFALLGQKIQASDKKNAHGGGSLPRPLRTEPKAWIDRT